VLKISHIGGLIATKYEEIIRLIFHTGTETMRQWGGWPTCDTFTTPPNSPTRTPTQSPDSSMNFANLSPKVSKEEYQKHMLLASESPGPSQHLPLANEVPDVLPEHAPIADPAQMASAPDIVPTLQDPFLSPLDALSGQTSAPQQQNTGNVGTQIPIPEESRPEVPVDSLVTPLDPQPPSPQPVPQFQALVFGKKDLDNAYKMDDSKFSTDFTIRFECAHIENDDVPANTWDENLYQEFIATYEVNKKNHELRGKTSHEEEKKTPRKDGLNEGWTLFDRPPQDVLY